VQVLRTIAAAAVLLPALHAPATANAPDGEAFVAAFRKACVPHRQSFEKLLVHAQSNGWRLAEVSVNAELQTVSDMADAAMSEGAKPGWTLTTLAFDGIVAGRLNYLVVSHIVAPKVARLVSCSLYDFDATEAIDPDLVTEFIGRPIAKTHKYAGLVAHSWDPPPALPGTLETNLTFVAEDSVTIKLTGFSGLVLKFDSSERDPAN
jgi:hypothetical protein